MEAGWSRWGGWRQGGCWLARPGAMAPVMPGAMPAPATTRCRGTTVATFTTWAALPQHSCRVVTSARWMAQAHGSIDLIEFYDFVWPEKTVTITKKVDTCIAREPAYKAKFLHWGLYTEIQANNLKEFPGIGLGGQVVIKDRLTIGLGAVYADKFYGNLRIGVLLK